MTWASTARATRRLGAGVASLGVCAGIALGMLLGIACSGGDPDVSSQAGACVTNPDECLDDAGSFKPNVLGVAPADCPGPDDVPSKDNCAAPGAPTYATVEPILAARCVPCHKPGGLATSPQFTTYDMIANGDPADMQTQISYCIMPPSCVCPLTSSERTALLQWLVCGHPQ